MALSKVGQQAALKGLRFRMTELQIEVDKAAEALATAGLSEASRDRVTGALAEDLAAIKRDITTIERNDTTRDAYTSLGRNTGIGGLIDGQVIG